MELRQAFDRAFEKVAQRVPFGSRQAPLEAGGGRSSAVRGGGVIETRVLNAGPDDGGPHDYTGVFTDKHVHTRASDIGGEGKESKYLEREILAAVPVERALIADEYRKQESELNRAVRVLGPEILTLAGQAKTDVAKVGDAKLIREKWTLRAVRDGLKPPVGGRDWAMYAATGGVLVFDTLVFAPAWDAADLPTAATYPAAAGIALILAILGHVAGTRLREAHDKTTAASHREARIQKEV